MRKMKSLVILLALLTFILQASPVSAAAPEVAGESAVLIDGRSGQLLFEKNPRQRLYPASTTKTLTAIVALENGNLADLVTVPGVACNIEGSSLGLQEGERITLEDLLYSLLLNSGNDTAIAIATHVGGSVEGFVEMMNKKATELGAVNSHFNNPNGLPEPDHYSTAYDMALIARYAMQNPEFRKMVSTKTRTISREVPEAQVYLDNHNKMLWRYEGAIGVKTGYTVEARQCLISAAARQGRELIAVVLKSEGSIWADSAKLLDYGFNEFENVTLTASGKVVSEVPVKFGLPESVPAQTGNSLAYNFPKDGRAEIRQEVFLKEDLTAPVKAGVKLGELAFFSGDRELGRVDLLAQYEVKRKIMARWWPWALVALGLLGLLGLIRRHNMVRRRRWERYRRKYYLY